MLNIFLIFSYIVLSVTGRSWLESRPKRTEGHDMLIGISVAANNRENRDFLRKYQIDVYPEYNVTWRFILSTPQNKADIEPILKENKTFGDIIMIPTIVDNRITARRDKPFHYYQWVEKNMPHYNYVAKMDNDTFMNMTGLYDRYFTEEIRNQKATLISYWVVCDLRENNEEFPQGAFYALSWDLMVELNKLYNVIPRHSDDEDIQLNWYLDDAKVKYSKVSITEEDHFDYNIQGTIWDAYKTMMKDQVRVHGQKTPDLYKKMARVFMYETGGHDETLLRLIRAEEELLFQDYIIYYTSIAIVILGLGFAAWKYIAGRKKAAKHLKKD